MLGTRPDGTYHLESRCLCNGEGTADETATPPGVSRRTTADRCLVTRAAGLVGGDFQHNNGNEQSDCGDIILGSIGLWRCTVYDMVADESDSQEGETNSRKRLSS